MLEGTSIADVGVAPDLQALLVSPRDVNDRHVRRLLQEASPGLTLLRGTEGLLVKPADAPRLLDVHSLLNWTSEARRFAENRAKALRIAPNLRARVDELRSCERGHLRSLLPDLADFDVLDDHQVTNIAAMTIPESYGLCVFDEQGAGKTVTFIFAFDYLVQRDDIDVALIVAPKSMVSEWPHDFSRFKGDLYKIAVVTGSRQEKAKALRKQADVIVTNFETAVAMELELRAVLRHHQDRAVIVVDESFFIKNPLASRTRALKRLREWCGRAFVLCGTPAPNAPQDIVEQFNFVDFGMTFSNVGVPEEREAARPIVQAAIDRHGVYLRHLKSEVLPDLPGKTFQRILVSLSPVQEKIYREILRGFIDELQQTTNLDFSSKMASFLARRVALLQTCSNPIAIAPEYRETPGKLCALEELLSELIVRQNEKVVIWSFYTESLNQIVKRFAKYCPVRYDGSVTSIDDRRKAVQLFQKDDQTMLFVGNPAAAGAGLTLHRARIAIYESFSNQAAHYLQSVDRIHRRGQNREVQCLILIADKTIEVSEFDRLLHKEASARELLGDRDSHSVTRETMLEEAMRALAMLRP